EVQVRVCGGERVSAQDSAKPRGRHLSLEPLTLSAVADNDELRVTQPRRSNGALQPRQETHLLLRGEPSHKPDLQWTRRSIPLPRREQIGVHSMAHQI